MKLKSKTARGILCTALGGISWGFSGACSQYLFMHYNVGSAWLTVVRMVSAGVLLLLSALPHHRGEVLGILKDKKDAAQLAAFAVAGLLLCQFAYLSAIQNANAGTATVLQNLSVVMLAVFSGVKARALPSKTQLVSIVLALAGVYLIATNGNPGTMVLSPKGLFWGLGAAAGAVSYSLLSQRLVAKWGSRVVTGYGMLIGGGVFFFLVRAWALPVSLDAAGATVVAVIVLVGTVGAFTLFLQGISDIGPVRATLIACLEPVTATAVSAFWLGTGFGLAELLGFCCILATVFLFVREK